MKKLSLREVKQLAQGQATELGCHFLSPWSEPLCDTPVARMATLVSCLSSVSDALSGKARSLQWSLSELEGILGTAQVLSWPAHWNHLETWKSADTPEPHPQNVWLDSSDVVLLWRGEVFKSPAGVSNVIQGWKPHRPRSAFQDWLLLWLMAHQPHLGACSTCRWPGSTTGDSCAR